MPASLILIMKMNAEKYIDTLSLGGIYLRLYSEIPLTISEDTADFVVDDRKMDAAVHVKLQTCALSLPEEECGRDLLMKYYRKDNLYYAAGRTEAVGDCSVTIYTPDFSVADFYINEEKYPGMIRKISKVLQLLPIRQFLSNYQAMLLHSSCVAVEEKALIFTAPSQTGKTTQARLWEQYGHARRVSNDRSLLRKQGNCFDVYGYPVDGSSPVCSNQRVTLGAVVVLRQGRENQVERLRVSKALKYLMEQTVADVWNAEELGILRQLWMELLEVYPVYLLTCRPDHEAVQCLKNQLKKDGVISIGDN